MIPLSAEEREELLELAAGPGPGPARGHDHGDRHSDLFVEEMVVATWSDGNRGWTRLSGSASRTLEGGADGVFERLEASSPAWRTLAHGPEDVRAQILAAIEHAGDRLREAGHEPVHLSAALRRIRVATRAHAFERAESRVEVAYRVSARAAASTSTSTSTAISTPTPTVPGRGAEPARLVRRSAATAASLDLAERADGGSADRALPPPPEVEIPLLLEMPAAAVLFHEIAHGLEADEATASPALALGSRIGPDGLTLTDDPTLAGRGGSFDCDDEGVPARALTLVAAGQVRAAVLDLRALRRLGVLGGVGAGAGADPGDRPTAAGHARRASFRDPPLPRLANLRVAPGSATLATLVSAARGRAGRVVSGAARLDGQGARLLAPSVEIDGRRHGPSSIEVGSEALHDLLLADATAVVAWALCGRLGQEVAVSTESPAVLVRARIRPA